MWRKTWEVEHLGLKIRVENCWGKESLFVGDELQNEQVGVLSLRSAFADQALAEPS